MTQVQVSLQIFLMLSIIGSLDVFFSQDLRRSNFTAADCRDCNFKDTNLQGAYFIKTVVPRANFEVMCNWAATYLNMHRKYLQVFYSQEHPSESGVLLSRMQTSVMC